MQNQINVLHAADKDYVNGISRKAKVTVLRKGGLLAAREKWVLGENQLEEVNSYKYLGLTFSTTQLCCCDGGQLL